MSISVWRINHSVLLVKKSFQFTRVSDPNLNSTSASLSYRTLGKSLNFSEPQFPPYKIEMTLEPVSWVYFNS